jgi:hypothetical protein
VSRSQAFNLLVMMMLVEKVDIERIKALIDSLPSKMEIVSIDLTDGYSVNLTAGETELNRVKFEKALNRLNAILDLYSKMDDKNKLLNE